MKKFFIIGLTIVLSIILISTKSFTQGTTTSKTNCYRCHTSLDEDLNAYIMLSVKDFTKKFDYDSSYYEVVVGKINFYTDGVKLDNCLEPSKDEIYISGVSKDFYSDRLEFVPVLVDKSLTNNKVKIGSVLRTEEYDNVRYYVIGYIENGQDDGLYEFVDDVDYQIMYGSMGRKLHFYEFELVQYQERK